MAIDLSLHTFRSPKLQSVVADALTFFVETPVHALPLAESFLGSGVYALYYLGGFEHYADIAAANATLLSQPIYVGKAVPPGRRTARTTTTTSTVLHRRLAEHSRSIQQAHNLTVDDFRCRFVILVGIESDLIVPVEAELIRRYLPLWNSAIDGFGNHDPGSGRYNQARSEWDVLHPGRPWAERLTGRAPRRQDVIAKIP